MSCARLAASETRPTAGPVGRRALAAAELGQNGRAPCGGGADHGAESEAEDWAGVTTKMSCRAGCKDFMPRKGVMPAGPSASAHSATPFLLSPIHSACIPMAHSRTRFGFTHREEANPAHLPNGNSKARNPIPTDYPGSRETIVYELRKYGRAMFPTQ